MKRTTVIAVIIGGVVMILLVLYEFNKDSLPPRTPLKVARLISGLSIPNDSKVEEFKDEWNGFNGNGFSYIVLSLKKEAFEKIYNEAESKGFKKPPIIEGIYGPLEEISQQKITGIYFVRIDDEATKSFKGTVLSETDGKIFIYFSVN